MSYYDEMMTERYGYNWREKIRKEAKEAYLKKHGIEESELKDLLKKWAEKNQPKESKEDK